MTTLVIDRSALPEQLSPFFASPRIVFQQRQGFGEAALYPVSEIMGTIEKDPYRPTQHFERLVGNMKGKCSRRITRHNRIVYKVLPNINRLVDANGAVYDGIVRVLSMWGHY